ncbi:hypothetical protein HGM15179_020366 [Zosterops borbonicus]|uniref:Uncharacterized protein n=1 Tax=Zosterops borbonicus TaxID=364589 RepID=A0A8K1FYG5_9PASS|nr:hypothetical protein HGM15179_020366 [Zosterops borbonicus]
MPQARLAREVTMVTTSTQPPAPAAPSAPVRSTGHTPGVPNAQDTPGTSTARPGHPGDDPQGRVRVARLSEAGLRQLGEISSHQRVLEWLDSTLASRAEGTAQRQEELGEKELDGDWEPEEHGNKSGGRGL